MVSFRIRRFIAPDRDGFEIDDLAHGARQVRDIAMPQGPVHVESARKMTKESMA